MIRDESSKRQEERAVSSSRYLDTLSPSLDLEIPGGWKSSEGRGEYMRFAPLFALRSYVPLFNLVSEPLELVLSETKSSINSSR